MGYKNTVSLTNDDIENGNINRRATTRMNERNGGLEKYAASCQHEIDWEQSTRIVGKEENTEETIRRNLDTTSEE